MKKSLCLTLLLAFVAFTAGFAQTLVQTIPMKANVVLEEYTGIHCQYCPDGHARAQALADQNPGHVVLINIHQGGYAVPSAGEPDYRTIFGDTLASQINTNGYPTGTINRHVFEDYNDNPGGTAMGRGYWAAAAAETFPLPTPVNVGLSSVFDTLSRLLTVTVETYYTAPSLTGVNYINVALLENGVIGPQQVLTVWNTSYTHNHMLRHFLTGYWGDTCSNNAMGDFNQRIYTYTVPAGINMNKCDVAAYVIESHQQVYTGAQVPAMGGTTLVVASVNPPGPVVEIGVPAVATDFSGDIASGLAGAEDFSFEFITDAPLDWSANYTVGATQYTMNDTISLTGGIVTNLDIQVTPGATPFIATYTLVIRSIANPMAPPIVREVKVISNITDLVLNNDEAWGDGTTTYSTLSFESNYLKGLQAASNTQFASTPKKTFMQVAAAGKLTGVEHIYFNIGWSFPSFTNDLVGVLSGFLDNGGNLFVSGQDAAWDTWDLVNGGNGTVITQAFYTDYLHTQFLNDGGASNTIMTPVNSDLVFGTLDTSAITNVYGGAYFYPDQIDTVGGSLPIFYYNSNLTKMGGLRATNGTYKIVYFGTSLEMIADTNIRKDVIHIAHDWFHGFISGAAEYDQAMQALFMGQNYPNPADGSTTILFSAAPKGARMEVYDLSGQKITEILLGENDDHLTLNTQNWNAGMYTYRLIMPDGSCEVKKLMIAH